MGLVEGRWLRVGSPPVAPRPSTNPGLVSHHKVLDAFLCHPRWRCAGGHTPGVTAVIVPTCRTPYSNTTSGEEGSKMFNDYGVANIVWQRQREAERVAAAYRLSLLAERGARSAAVVGGGSSLAARLARRIAH